MTTQTTTAPAEPEVDVTPGHVAHVTATQLADAVALVRPHVCPERDGHPTLAAYRIDEREGALWISATDRYSAAAARVAPLDLDKSTGMRQQFPSGYHAVVPAALMHRTLSTDIEQINAWIERLRPKGKKK